MTDPYATLHDEAAWARRAYWCPECGEMTRAEEEVDGAIVWCQINPHADWCPSLDKEQK